MDSTNAKEAALYERAEGGRVVCNLCSFRCHIAEGKRGLCAVRENRGGKLYSLVYRRLISAGSDPIEKKPLFHVMPGSRSFSIATVGCNFRCLHCQNSSISQMARDTGRIMGEDVGPEEIVANALKSRCKSIAYTYTEPTIFFEYAEDTALLAREAGLKNIFVSNGYMTRECIDRAVGFLDAANIDLKTFNDETHKKLCGGARLEHVLETISYMREKGIWVEVTTLVIPGLNDSDEELRHIAKWIYKTDPAMPWHISAFHPSYKLTDKPRTPVATLDRAREIGFDEGLRYVYTGNAPGDEGESTYCYNCDVVLIKRFGFEMEWNFIKESKCPECGALIDGIDL